MADSSCSKGEYGTEVLRFAMVGMTGTGKSATGNSIVGAGMALLETAKNAWRKYRPFASTASCQSVTVQGSRKDIELFGRKVAIVDTPGFFDTKFTEEVTTKEILKCTYLIAPGPHAILLVVNTGRQTAEVVRALEHMKKMFGPHLVRHLIIIFTGLDNIERDGSTIEKYLANLKPEYKMLLHQAENRYVAFDNTANPSSPENKQQVKTLIEMAEKITARNGGTCYSNDLLEQSYEMVKEARIEADLKKRIKPDYDALLKKIQETNAALAQEQALLRKERERGKNGCFASTSTVLVRGAEGQLAKTSLKDLKVGDLVESYDPDTNTVMFSPVYFITYQDDDSTMSSLRRLFYEDDDGNSQCIAIYPKHLIYANVETPSSSEKESVSLPPQTPVMAEDVEVGHILWVKASSGKLCPKPVVKVDDISSSVRHPLTLSHYIVVDGVLASVHVGNEWLLRKVTAPLRLVYKISPTFNDSWFTKKMVQSWDQIENYFLV